MGGPENQAYFHIHLSLECIANLHLHGVPKKIYQIVLKFGPETDNIVHYSVCNQQTSLSS
jgi:hypothetical protein